MVWLPGVHPRMISPQDICYQQGIAWIIAGSTLSETPPGTSHLVGMQNVELGVSLVPEKIDQDRMCRFQAYIAVGNITPQFLTHCLDLPEAFLGVWDC